MKLRIRINNRQQLGQMILCMMLLVTMLEPQAIIDNFYTHLVSSGIRMSVGIICFFLFVNEKKFPVLFLGIIPYFIVQFMSVLVNRLAWNLYLPECIGELSLVMFCSWMFYKDKKLFLESLYRIFWVYMLVNMIYMLLNPWTNRFDAAGFLGGKNAFGPIAICIMMVSMLRIRYVNEKKQKICSGVLALLAVIECFWLGSSTGIVGCICFLCGLLLLRYVDEERKLFMPLYVTSWILFYLVIIVRIFEHMAELIFLIFGKDVSLSGRTKIWDATMNYVSEKWLLGYGDSTVVGVAIDWGNSRMRAAHNGVLDLLIVGGILLLLAYEVYTCLSPFHAEKSCNRDVQICVMAWFAFRTMLLAEYYQMSGYFVLITIIMFYSPRLKELIYKEN